MAILEKTNWSRTRLGRIVPETVNGRPQVPYMGVGKYRPLGGKGCARRSAPPPTIPQTATNVLPISKPRCASAACAMAWSFPRIIIFAMATASR